MAVVHFKKKTTALVVIYPYIYRAIMVSIVHKDTNELLAMS